MRLRYLGSVSALAITLGAGGQAFAADEAKSNTLETVVITAQKRTEKLEDVTVAASVVSAGDLAKNNVSDISDLNHLVPSVELNGTINGRVPMAIRGVSSNAPEGAVGAPSGVLISVDGVPVPSDAFGANQLEDVQNIEVLKGPQSTLGGRTAAQGVINVVTHAPTSTFKNGFNLTGTGDGEFRGNGFISGPLTDKASFSVAGWAATVPYPIKNVYNGADKSTTQDFEGLRAKLRYEVSENLDVTLAVRGSESKSDGFNFVYTYLQPGASLFGNPNLTPSTILPGIKADWNNTTNDTVGTSSAKVADFETSLIVNYKIGEDTLTSTTSILDERSANTQDLFDTNAYEYNVFYNTTVLGPPGSPTPAILCGVIHAPAPFCSFPATWNNTQTLDYHVQQETEELKLVSPADKKFSYIVGLFFSDTRSTLDTFRGLPLAYTNERATPNSFSMAAYGRGTYKFTDDLALIVGLRLNDDVIKYGINQIANGTFGGVPNLVSDGSTTKTTPVGDIALQKKFGPDQMAYVSYSRGYSPAIFNTNATLTTSAVLTPVKQEDIDSFEIGSKGYYLDHRLMVNADVFYTKYTNYQVKQILQDGTTNPPQILANGDADTKGVELDTLYQATPTLRLTGNFAWIDAKFTNYNGAPCYPSTTNAASCTLNLSGTPLPNAPKVKFNIGADQRIPLENTPYVVSLGGNYSWRDKAQMLADGNPESVQKAFGLLNLHISVEDRAHHATVTLFADNVFAKTYYTDVEDFWGSPWGANAIVGQPGRDSKGVVGLKLNASF